MKLVYIFLVATSLYLSVKLAGSFAPPIFAAAESSFSVSILEEPTSTPLPPLATPSPTASAPAGPAPPSLARTLRSLVTEDGCGLPAAVLAFGEPGTCYLPPERTFAIAGDWYSVWQVDEKKCDVNINGSCDMVDLSILLYYIGQQ